MSAQVRFLAVSGAVLAEVTAEVGERLLTVAQAAGLPLEGTCGGQLACATCHLLVIAAPPLPAPTAEEEDLLDLLPAATRHSRLSCQLRLPPGLVVAQLPKA